MIRKFCCNAALCLCVVLAVLPLGAAALSDGIPCTPSCSEESYVAAIGETHYTSVQAALDCAQENDEVVLLQNVELTSTLQVHDGCALTLDLNGKTISGNNISSSETASVFLIDGNLTLQDSSELQTGRITGGRGTKVSDAICGGGVYLKNGSLTMTGGNIVQNTAENGGGVYVSRSACFSILGGSIVQNTAACNRGDSINRGNGGGVYCGKYFPGLS